MAFVALAVVVGMGLIALSLVLYFNQRSRLNRLHSATGEVVGYNRSPGSEGGWLYQPVVRFRTESDEDVEFEGGVGTSWRPYAVGHRVPVVYEPDNPHRADVRSFVNQWLACLIVGGIGGTFFVCGGFVLLVWALVSPLQEP